MSALAVAFAQLFYEYPVLRTGFDVHNRVLVQVVRPPRAQILPMVDLTGLVFTTRAAVIGGLVAQGDVFRRDRCARIASVHSAADDHLLAFDLPHALVDLWSVDLLQSRLDALVAAARRGQPPPPVAARHFVDVVQDERKRWPDGAIAAERERWRRHLEGVGPVRLPTVGDRPHGRVRECRVFSKMIPEELADSVRVKSIEFGVSPFVFLLSAFHLLLGAAGDVDRLVTTSAVASRDKRGALGVVGPLSDRIAVVADLSGAPTFDEVLDRTRSSYLDALDLRGVPLLRIHRELDPTLRIFPHPLEQFSFDMHNVGYSPKNSADLVGAAASYPAASDEDECPWVGELSFEIHDSGSGPMPSDVVLDVRMHDAHVWFSSFLEVLGDAVADPSISISALPVLASMSRTILSPGGGTVDGLSAEARVAPRDSRARRAPETPCELAVSAVWQSVVGRAPLHVRESFFNDDVTLCDAVEFVQRLADTPGVEVPLEYFLADPVVTSVTSLMGSDHTLNRR